MSNISIRVKLFVTTISILVISMVITSTLNIVRFRSLYIDAQLERARADAHDMIAGIKQGLDYFPLESFSDMTVFLNAHLYKDFSYSYIADDKGKILYHSDGKTKDVQLDPVKFGKLVFSKDIKSIILSVDGFYEMILPITHDFGVIGTVHIGIKKSLVDNIVFIMMLQNVGILLAALVVSIILMYILLTRNFTNPIAKLVKKIADISTRFKLAESPASLTGDELAKFSESFDTMTHEIEAKTEALTETNRMLEIDIMQRKLAEKKLKESYENLRITFEGSIKAIATAVESRDPYTAGHQQRVAQLACAIAKDIGMNDDKIREIYFSAMSHDIGKIAVPTAILTKRGELTDEEYAVIKTHPQVGYDILRKIEFPWAIAKIVRQHHERLDGSGYPGHLKAEDILFESRIIAVSDVVEAIASARPYRDALGDDVAIDEISKNSGRSFDPLVVETCIKLFREKGFKFKFE